MTDLALTLQRETSNDAAAIERLSERTFGPGRFARTAYRIREGGGHALELSFTAWIATLLVGSNRMTRITIGTTPAVLLGPLTVEPDFRKRGIGAALIRRSIEAAREAGYKLVVLVGDEPYYGRLGFKVAPSGAIRMPGPVDPARLLVLELEAGALEGVSGAVRAALTED